MTDDPKDRIGAVIRAYDAQGWHRTGTAVDIASGGWLVDELRAVGADARLETYPFRRVEPLECSLALGDTRMSGLPMFDGGFTSSQGVAGRLGRLGSDAEIGVVAVPAGGPAEDLDRARHANVHDAIISITTGGRAGLAPRNAPAYPPAPGGTPVLQVSSEFRGVLEDAVDRGDRATVLVRGAWHDVSASNVLAEISGTSPSAAPVVVMTPRSGWWQCASERGGGIAALLEIARSLAQDRRGRTVLFLASTGHELGHWGLDRFLGIRPHLATAAPLWLHLGASVGAALSPSPLLFCSSDANERIAGEALARAGIAGLTQAPRSAVPGGESKNVHELGGSYVSLAGGSAVFHLEADRWPDAVDVDAVAAYATAATEIVRIYAT